MSSVKEELAMSSVKEELAIVVDDIECQVM